MRVAMRVEFSERARLDIIEHYHYGLEQFGRDAAESYANALLKATQLIAAQPKMARLHTEYTPPVRIHPIRQHLIVYVVREETILVVRILQHGTDVTRHLPVDN